MVFVRGLADQRDYCPLLSWGLRLNPDVPLLFTMQYDTISCMGVSRLARWLGAVDAGAAQGSVRVPLHDVLLCPNAAPARSGRCT